jgi:hypothetical protein
MVYACCGEGVSCFVCIIAVYATLGLIVSCCAILRTHSESLVRVRFFNNIIHTQICTGSLRGHRRFLVAVKGKKDLITSGSRRYGS